MSVSLYRKYRPCLFSEVVGQETAVGVLLSSYAEGKLGHAYLFSGPRGCGKTTAARLLAKIVNCLAPAKRGEPCCECESCEAVASGAHMDVMEIDGASNRGIDQIRELKSHVGLSSFMGGMKVYILDEVHMLTMEAFNALLKTLEEPPPSVMFIFATTEPHKVPVTIRSRCQHIPFHRIPTEGMVGQLKRIAEAEGVSADDSALWEISRGADGALRDAISLFEQAAAISHGKLTPESVRTLFGGGGRAETERWVTLIRERPDDAAAALREALDLGVSPERFLDGLFPLLRDMWAFSLWDEKSYGGASLSPDEKDFLKREAPNWNTAALKRAAAACAALFPRARMGLRNDVFAGLLLFEMLNSFDAPETSSAPLSKAKPAGSSRALEPSGDAVSLEKNAPRPYGGDMGGAHVPRAARQAVRQPSAPADSAKAAAGASYDFAGLSPPAADCSIHAELNEILYKLALDDMPTAAALIDARVFREGNSLRLDFSDAAKAAAVILSGTRARGLLESAFGLSSDGDSSREADAGGIENPAGAAFDSDGWEPPSAEAISARLGADILMSRRLDMDGGDTGDIEDDQF